MMLEGGSTLYKICWNTCAKAFVPAIIVGVIVHTMIVGTAVSTTNVNGILREDIKKIGLFSDIDHISFNTHPPPP